MIGSALIAIGLADAATPPRLPSTSDVLVRVLDRDAQAARRARYWRGGLSLAAGATQIGLGAYGLASPQFDAAMKRSAVAQLVFGTATSTLGVLELARRSPMERLHSSAQFEAFAADPSDPQKMADLRRRWRDLAHKSRIRRFVVGGGYVVGGVGLVITGTILHFSDVGPGGQTERLWSFTTLASGIGLALAGSLNMAIPRHCERSYTTWANALGWPPSTKRRHRRIAIRLRPSLGGVVVRGAF